MSKEKEQKEVPEGAKIIAILTFISSAIFLLVGLILVKAGEGVGKLGLSEMALISQQGFTFPGAASIIVIGLIFIAVSIFFYFIGRDLFRLKAWARIAAGILAVLGLIISLSSLVQGAISSILEIIIFGLIAWYLLINKRTRKTFN